MSTFIDAPHRWLSGDTNEENDIRTIFYLQWEKAMSHYAGSVNRINTWREEIISHIHKYADEQISILTADYNQQRVTFNEKYQENVALARDCGAQNAELFNDLKNACKLLEFQIVQLEAINTTMVGFRVITSQEQMERKKKEQADAARSEQSKPEEKQIIQPTHNLQDNQTSKKDEHANVTSAISNETQSHPSMVIFSNDNNQSINSNVEYQSFIKQDNDSINKCPICFMIFPLSMSQDERSQHVNEHYGDD